MTSSRWPIWLTVWVLIAALGAIRDSNWPLVTCAGLMLLSSWCFYLSERATEPLRRVLALADEFDAQVPWPHSWIGNRIREAAGVNK